MKAIITVANFGAKIQKSVTYGDLHIHPQTKTSF